MLKTSFILCLSVFLFSCSSIPTETQSDIESNNWQAVGEYDGSNGLLEKSEVDLQALSDQFNGGNVSYSAYQSSYLAAVTIYCEPKNANMLGMLGKPYLGVCERFPNGVFFRQDWLNAKTSNSR
jgi:hypothetical protein